MILDVLPFSKSKGRVPGRWGWIRYFVFAASLGLVLLLWFGFGYRIDANNQAATELPWFLVGNALYYLVGIVLAFVLKDNRAFCKYVCPITVFLKTTSRFSVLKIRGDKEKCDNCGACVKMCPMDINIPEYLEKGKRVMSTECILCLTCINACPKEALEIGAGLDARAEEILVERDE